MMPAINSFDTHKLRAELFKRGNFDFITLRDGQRHEKQQQALEILTDKDTTEFLFGGGAGGSKTWTGCSWLLFSCLAYPGSKWFVGRKELKILRETVLQTMYKVIRAYEIPQSDFKYNGQDHYLQFNNGSRIDFLTLAQEPSDPLFERYGSLEFTGGWLEEAGEAPFDSYDTLKTRIGRHMNDEYNLCPKLFITCNPKKNWLKSVFFDKEADGTLEPDKKFLQALVQDNPFIEKNYQKQLEKTTDKSKRARLLLGEWDYEDSPDQLMQFEVISDLFNNTHVSGNGRYITADVARLGKDNTVVRVWEGWKVIKTATWGQVLTTVTADRIKAIAKEYRIPVSRIIVDEDGLGSGIVDMLHCKGFVNNSSPLKVKGVKPNFANLKAQCYYHFADMVNKGEVWVQDYGTERDKELTIEELEVIRAKDVDKDRKLQIIPKDQMKLILGRSPDYADSLMMRSYFDLYKPQIRGSSL